MEGLLSTGPTQTSFQGGTPQEAARRKTWTYKVQSEPTGFQEEAFLTEMALATPCS